VRVKVPAKVTAVPTTVVVTNVAAVDPAADRLETADPTAAVTVEIAGIAAKAVAPAAVLSTVPPTSNSKS
jgi:hypothetical protein